MILKQQHEVTPIIRKDRCSFDALRKIIGAYLKLHSYNDCVINMFDNHGSKSWTKISTFLKQN
ncbi:conserved hypothetical protein [Vibrio crassostreae]|uniref:Uncharacterized protein n=1 Tax=Vibrio crassostreae TaxID=246167 RepID=A0A822MVW3_9VIBR|nr:conserved hypothetical protein [Vibrio crassostreae]CDT08730.1 conserved hypothetical protein [Vibrio crassostreae]CDT33661.1 conserved hypothetical protein [Vibrio crassostreae]CDT34443.1 conserved hypothetical protein [Vibrio crassostreae]CDT40278.1 conserved hypothetical protein [Vibrio crassostreae]